jgi:hypothetical protein
MSLFLARDTGLGVRLSAVGSATDVWATGEHRVHGLVTGIQVERPTECLCKLLEGHIRWGADVGEESKRERIRPALGACDLQVVTGVLLVGCQKAKVGCLVEDTLGGGQKYVIGGRVCESC